MIEVIDRHGTVMCPLCIEDKSDVKLIKLSSDYLYGTFALCKGCREKLIKALGSCSHGLTHDNASKVDENSDRLLDEFEEIADKYYDMLLKIHYKEPYFNKSQNERYASFLQNKVISFVEKTGATDEQVKLSAAAVVHVVTDPDR